MSCHEEAVALQRQLDELNAEIALREDYESDSYHRLLEDLASITGQLEHFNLSTLEVETIRILKGLGFTDADLPRQVAEFSGGWKMRIELAKLLLRNPDILMLDEPTNHLDIESIIWLEGYLTTYPGTVIVISHDIQFLENVCNRILEIEWGQISDYRMGYKRFLEEKEKQQSVRLSAYENQQRDIAQKEKTINRFMAKATKTKMAQSMQKQLDKVEQTVFSNVDITIERGDRVAFVGQNGQGKTTMAKIIAGVLPPSSGKVETGSNLHMSYYAQNQSELLDLKKTVLEVMEDKAPEEMRTKVRSILGAFLFSGDDADKKVSVLSGGERARLAMASLIMRPCNFLILDEPTNHLDIYSKEVLKLALAEYQGTLLVISHDREFLEGLTSKVIEFRSGSTREFLGDINYFLERRKLQDMRAIEESGSRKVDESTQASSKPEGEELRRMRKLVQQAEREIAKLEQEIALIEVKLSDPDFYAAPEFVDTNKKYAELQDQLIGKMEEWEALLTRLEG